MTLRLVTIGAFALALSACGRPEPVAVPVTVQPTFDKLGRAECPGGYQLATTADGATVCSPIGQ